jgi:hypothetical protein
VISKSPLCQLQKSVRNHGVVDDALNVTHEWGFK